MQSRSVNIPVLEKTWYGGAASWAMEAEEEHWSDLPRERREQLVAWLKVF
jgi:hypothetical protein